MTAAEGRLPLLMLLWMPAHAMLAGWSFGKFHGMYSVAG